MGVQEIFAVLEIPQTKDENKIRGAYRRLLAGVNPEDDPEGFKRLRGAYEEALTYSKTPDENESIQEAEWMEEKGPAGDFLRTLAQIYTSLPRRLDVDEWKNLTRDPVLQSLDEGETAKWGLFSYLADHFRLPCRIWRLLDEAFLIRENEQEFREHLPAEFMDFFLYKIGDGKGLSDFPFEEFRGDPEADYDGFLERFMAFLNEDKDETEQGLKTVERKLEELDSFGVSHPWLDLEKAGYLFRAGKKGEAEETIRALIKNSGSDPKVLLTGAGVLLNCGYTSDAEEIYKGYLERENRTDSGTYTASFGLAGIEASRENWENARKLAMDARDLRGTEEVQSLLKKINEELIALYTARGDELTCEEAERLGWCFIHTERAKEAWEFFKEHTGCYRDTMACHKLMAVLCLASEMPENSVHEVEMWRRCVEQEMEKVSGDDALDREAEKERLKGELAKSYQMEGRALRELCRRMDESGEEKKEEKEGSRQEERTKLYDRSLAAFDRAVEMEPDNIDFLMHRLMLLRDRKEYQAMVGQCERILELDGSFFWACFYMQEAYEEMRMAQEVVDTFYRAKRIYGGNEEIYLRALRVFKAYRQYKDALDIISQAEEAGVESHELMVEKIGILDRLAESVEDWQEADDYAGKVIARLKEEASAELLADAYLKRAYLNDSGDKNNKLKGQKLDLKYAMKSLEYKDTAAVRYCLGRYYMEFDRNPGEAYTHLKLCEKMGMKYEWMYFYIARCHESFKDWNQAIAYYKKVMECNPEFNDCYWRIGWLYRNKFYRTLLQPYADKAIYYYNLQGEKFGVAADHFRKRATIYLKMKEYDKALEEINEGLARDGDSGMWLFKGQILRALNRYDEAVVCFENSIKAEDRFGEDDAFCYNKIFQCFLREKRWEEGTAYFKKALETAETEEIKDKCLKILVDLEADAGHLEEALKWLEKRYGSVDLSFRSCSTWEKEAQRIEDVLDIWYEFRFSTEEELREKCEPAAALAQEAAEDEKDEPEGCALYYQNIGEAYFYLGDYERGLYFFEQAFRLAEGAEEYDYSKSLYKSLMMTWYWLGRPEQGEKFAQMYRRELEKDYKDCGDLGISMEEMLTGPTTKSKQVLYHLFCWAYYTGKYDQARRYGEMMESRDMCWWCDEPGCTEAWEIRAYLALLDGKQEEALEAFKQADRFCWLGGGKGDRMMMRRIEKEIKRA
ncbi:MAG: tetratricopeptide repeat protein [Clostridium sp.]|nr:tetratricopeptide repeat protein [Clostridium sp.]